MARITNSAVIGSAVAKLAARQHGVVSREQLRGLGLTNDALHRWLRDGRIQRIHRGVYAPGHANLDPRGRIHAAVLACGARAVVSHRSAAYLLGIGERSPLVVDLISSTQRGRRLDGIRLHSVPFPKPTELVWVQGIPVTSVARTIVDLAGVHGEKGLAAAIERAATQRVLDIAQIDAVLANGPKRRGAPCLRRIVDDWRPVAETAKEATFRSLFEAKLLPLIAAAGLPLPRFNVPVHTAERILEVDLFWERERFVVEADSRKHHGIEVAFDRDHRRRRELLAAGYGFLGVTWREAEREAPAVFSVIRQELTARAPQDSPASRSLSTSA
jgi:very-short-patch-repair endonuclease